MRVVWLLLLLGCDKTQLAICDCPAPPAPDLSSAPPPDLSSRPDLTTVVDLANGDAPQVPVLLELLPNTPWRVGDTVKVLGRNLGCERSSCWVNVGSAYAQPLPGADETTLTFVVPGLPLPPAGAYEELTLSNPAGTVRQLVAVVPAPPPPVAPAGTLTLLWRNVDRTSLDVGQATRFQFTLRSNLNQPLPVTVSAASSGGGPTPSVQDGQNGQPLAGGATRDFVVELDPSAGNGAFHLDVRANAGAAIPGGFFGAFGLQVAAPLPPQDFALDLRGQAQYAHSAVDDLMVVDAGGAVLSIIGELRSAGTWNVDAQASSADWTLKWLGSTTQLSATPADVAAGPATRGLRLLITPGASAANGTVTVTAQQSGASTARTLRFRLIAAD